MRRHDYLVNLFQAVVETLLFYHPAVWWVSTQVRRERENCCDDLAVAVCGDRLGYARALVELEGLRGGAPRLAMAASGGSLSARVRRWSAAPGAPRAVPGRPACWPWHSCRSARRFSSLAPAPPPREVHRDANSNESGKWTAEKHQDQLRLTIKTGESRWQSWILADDYAASEFSGLANGSDVRFELRRDAGIFRFQGSFDGRRGHGTFAFTADPAYAREIGEASYDHRLLELAAHDVPLAYVHDMKTLGYARSPQRNGRFQARDLVPAPLREIVGQGDRDQAVEQLVELRRHGVTPELARSLRRGPASATCRRRIW